MEDLNITELGKPFQQKGAPHKCPCGPTSTSQGAVECKQKYNMTLDYKASYSYEKSNTHSVIRCNDAMMALQVSIIIPFVK